MTGWTLDLVVLVDLIPAEELDLARLEAVLAGGATVIQLRGKEVSAGRLHGEARRAHPLCRAAGVPLFVNDRADIALAAGTEGVHLGPEDLSPVVVRTFAPDLLLGVSARTPDRVALAERAGAAYLGVGAFRASRSKTGAVVIGPEGIAGIAGSTRIPVVAIGGLRPGDAPAVRGAGAAGMAVLSGIMEAEDPESATRRYREAWRNTP
jgi:thiamine-phosphate pyrophosphorylase